IHYNNTQLPSYIQLHHPIPTLFPYTTLFRSMFITLGSSLIAVSVGLSLICLGFFVTHSIASTTVSQTATHHKGSASSLYLVAYYLGVSMGTTLLAPLWENFNWTGIILLTVRLTTIYMIIFDL